MIQKNTRKTLRRNALALAAMAALGFTAIDANAAPMKPAYRDALSGALVHADTIDPGQTYSRLIIKYEKNSPPGLSIAESNASARALTQGLGRRLEFVRRLATGADLFAVDGAPMNAAQVEAMMARIARDPNVEYVEPDAMMQAFLTPNDTRYTEQWHYFDAVAGMNVPGAWDIHTGTGVTVAVIDTGITPHSDLSANVVAGYDFVSDATAARDGNGRDSNPNDEGDWYAAGECGQVGGSNSSWHGTHVTGTIGAVTNNASGVAGVAYGAKVQPVRVLAKCGGSLSDIADAIVWASGGTVTGITANPTPATVINMSLGGSGACGTTYQAAIDSAFSRGTVVVVAAGNSNADVSGFRPANCNNTVTVAASDKEGNRASYSNYGAGIDVTAPGGETATASKGVLSNLNAGTTTQGAASYAFYQGTSMASPHVAGVAALIKGKDSTKTPTQILDLLKANTRALAGTCSGGCGSGLVDAAKTLQNIAGGGGGGGGNVLTNGVAATGLTAATGAAVNYTMAVPAGASALKFVTAGGTGDGDMYVKFGSAPTTSVYDCRPYLGGNAETCNMATATAGTWYVMVRAYAAFSGVSLTGSYTTGGGGTEPSFFQNLTDYTIADNATVESPVTVAGRTGNAPTGLRVAVDIRHTYIGDLKVDLVAPDGSIYVLQNRTGAGTDNIITTYTVNASTEVANGTWKLRVNDNATQDTGYINSWSLQF